MAAKHRCYIHRQTYAMHAAVCKTCQWMSGDYADRGDAERDAGMHERGECHPWEPAEIREWTPHRRPFVGT